jgi:hypothetical protein
MSYVRRNAAHTAAQRKLIQIQFINVFINFFSGLNGM